MEEALDEESVIDVAAITDIRTHLTKISLCTCIIESLLTRGQANSIKRYVEIIKEGHLAINQILAQQLLLNATQGEEPMQRKRRGRKLCD
jgi:hypothetical protein